MIGAAFTIAQEALQRLAALPRWRRRTTARRACRAVGRRAKDRPAAQEAWRAAGLSDFIHTIYPFQNPVTGGPATDDPAKGDPATLVDPGPEFGPWTGLDALGPRARPDQAHAGGQLRLRGAALRRPAGDLVEIADPVRSLRRANGTVRRAGRGLPVIWLKPRSRA